MKQSTYRRATLASLVALTVLLVMAIGTRAVSEEIVYVAPTTPEPKLTHAQDTWMRALEWCESRGNPEAVNPEDLDGTPSYGSWQFKPSTLAYYAKMYGVATSTLMDREYQRAVVEQMILHRNEINWSQQFPWCVKKLGPPPAAK